MDDSCRGGLFPALLLPEEPTHPIAKGINRAPKQQEREEHDCECDGVGFHPINKREGVCGKHTPKVISAEDATVSG